MTIQGTPASGRYAEAGVDIDAGARSGRSDRALGQGHRPRRLPSAALGGFGGLFDLAACGFRDPLLVATTDGVGTKVLLAAEAGAHHAIGIDLVAMCVNDLVVQGAQPLFFLDYFATGRLVPAMAARGGRRDRRWLPAGRLRADRRRDRRDAGPLWPRRVRPRRLCRRCGRARRRAAAPDRIADGDVVLGLASSGVHANGFSLVRLVLREQGLG